MKSLAIGDDRSAILIIQQSQTDPQKALAEFIENAIDARASRICITRHRSEGEVELIIEDNGEGVRPGPDNQPDFDRIATGICDSYKKYLDARQREGVQGEFAIGILGFAAIGGELEMLSRTAASGTRGMRLRAGSVEYETFAPRKPLAAPGTRVRIGSVRKEIQNRLTAEKLSRYLGAELRDRIRSSQAQLQIVDRLAGGKTLVVQPRKFEGVKIPNLSPVVVGGGRVRFELYLTGDGVEGRIGVSRRGTRVLDDLCHLEEFDHEPWNLGRIEGLIQYDLLTPAPASRKAIVPDGHLAEFIKTVVGIEPSVSRFIKEVEQARDEELDRELHREIQEAFAAVLEDLTTDYTWFGNRPGGPLPGTRSAGGSRRTEVRLSRGPLHALEILPRLAQLSPGESKVFRARAFDPSGALIPVDVTYEWRLLSHLATLAGEGAERTLTAGEAEGEGSLSVVARQGDVTRQSEAGFLILKVKKAAREKKLPFLEAVSRPAEPWRSRWVESRNVIEYNSGHPNYLATKQHGKRALFRYISLLVAKELVLHNFSGKPESLLLERMVEVVSALQRTL
jgi:hypothetical protein